MARWRGPQKANNETLRQFDIHSRPNVLQKGQRGEKHAPAAWIVHELLHCVKEQQQLQYRQEHPEEDLRVRATLHDCDKCAGSQGMAAEHARKQLARFVALLLKRVCVRGNTLGLGSSVEAFNSLNSFIDRRLEALVGILLPWAADPEICSALNTLATGATDFTCKAWVRASIAAPLITRFAIAVLRCVLEQGQQGGDCWQLAGSHLEAVCGCVRMAFMSLDDVLRIVASAPDGHTDLKKLDLRKTFQDISTHFKQLYKQVLMCHVGKLHVSAVLLAAIQLECSPIIFDASDKWVSPTLINLLKEKRWVGDLCTRLHSFRTGTDNVWEGEPADTTGRPGSEFTGLLQLLKAVLQATELFSHRHKDLQRAAHDLILLEPDVETGITVSLLESLIRTLCGEAPMSTAHAHKAAFILRICVARHSNWHLSERLFGRQRLLTTVSSVLDSALGEKQAAEGARESAKTQHSTSLQKDPEACSWSFSGLTSYKITALPLVKLLLNFGGHLADNHQGKVSAGEARRFTEAYADRVRVGMAADKAPAVAAVARAIVEQEETLFAAREGAPPLVLRADFARLRQLLESYMPEATGCGIPIDHNRRDNICKGAATDDALPQDLMEDAFLGATGTLPNRGEGPPCTQAVNPRRSASKGRQAEVASDTLAMQSTAVGGDVLKDQAALSAELHEKLAELQRLRDLKAAAVMQQNQSAQSQGLAQYGSALSSASLANPQAYKTSNPYARAAGPPNQAVQYLAGPVNDGSSSSWGNNIFSLGKRLFKIIS